jgi:hypothetical protein
MSRAQLDAEAACVCLWGGVGWGGVGASAKQHKWAASAAMQKDNGDAATVSTGSFQSPSSFSDPNNLTGAPTSIVVEQQACCQFL